MFRHTREKENVWNPGPTQESSRREEKKDLTMAPSLEVVGA